MLTRTGRGLTSFVLAFVLGAVAFVLVMAIEWITGDIVMQPTLVAVLLAAWYGGLGPGLLALALVVVATPLFAVAPHSAHHSMTEYLTPALVVIPLGILTALFGHEGRAAVTSLRRSERLFEAFMSNLPGAAWMKDREGRYAYANDEALRVFRTDRLALYGQADDAVFPQATAAQFAENDRVALVGGRTQTIEALDHQDGTHQSLVVKFPVLSGEGEVQFVGGVAIDITDRYRAEQALEQRSTQLQLVIDAVPALVSYIDRDQRYVFNNKLYEEWFGQPASAFVGRSLAELLHEDTYRAVKPYIERALAGEVVEYETQVHHHDGSLRWVQSRNVPHVAADGKVAGLFTLILDMTGRKQLDTERDLLADVTTHLSESLLVHDAARGVVGALVPAFADGAVVYLLPNGESRTVNVVGGSGGAAFAHSIEVAPEDVASVARTGTAVLYRRAPLDFVPPHAPGNEALPNPGAASVMYAPIVADGEVLAVIGTWTARQGRAFQDHDYTLLQEIGRRAGLALRHSVLYEESRRVADELIVANSAKDEFLGTVSHELRTPITVILGNASLLANRHRQMDEDTVSASLADLLGQAERLHRVVENMLILTRLDSGAGSVELEPFPITRSISQVVVEAQRQQVGRVIRLESSDWDLFAVGSEGYVHQVLLNYLNNAMRYSPAREPVDISVHQVEDRVEVNVLDRGVGIEESDIAGLFKPFYRSPRTPDDASGMGIGLSVSKRLIEALGGTVWARQREGSGAEFGFSLPVAPGREPGDDELAPRPPAVPAIDEVGAPSDDSHTG